MTNAIQSLTQLLTPDQHALLLNTYQQKRAPIISIEGNIGSGKSTLMAELKLMYADTPDVIFLQEPVDEWNTICDEEGRTMLEKFYANQTKYSFSFQMMAYISRLSVIRTAIRNNPGCIFISERCLHTDKHVFAKMLYDDNKIESVDYQIYNRWFNTFIDDFVVTNIVYIKTDAPICSARIGMRAREGEGSIPIEYLEACGEYHNTMMKHMECDILVLNGNMNINTSPNEIHGWTYLIDTLVTTVRKSLSVAGSRASTPEHIQGSSPKTKKD